MFRAPAGDAFYAKVKLDKFLDIFDVILPPHVCQIFLNMVVIPSALGIGYSLNSSMRLTGSRLRISPYFWAMILQISAIALFAASSTMLGVLKTMGRRVNLVRL